VYLDGFRCEGRHMIVRMKYIVSDPGVSRMTVSKALRNHGDISPETRNHVAKLSQQLGYHHNWAPRSPVAQRPDLLTRR
jgi:DNA-binding LacI/PurR family transcriptional regulator